ncbi:hypothetical protein RIF29_00358 [Crotalaria pallida]|uniref:Uncharacterized protein n=1 Tax=Crotalaria pallida TaxID=3830 RepID=A0AAN9IVK3_CROPI
MEALAEQNLGEKHEKPSSDGDDQKARSNKKVKTDEMRSGDVVEMVDIQKPSYREDLIPPSIQSIIAAVVPPSIDAGADSITWARENDGVFSIASSATLLHDTLLPGNFNGTNFLFCL